MHSIHYINANCVVIIFLEKNVGMYVTRQTHTDINVLHVIEEYDLDL